MQIIKLYFQYLFFIKILTFLFIIFIKKSLKNKKINNINKF